MHAHPVPCLFDIFDIYLTFFEMNRDRYHSKNTLVRNAKNRVKRPLQSVPSRFQPTVFNEPIYY